MIRPAGDGAEYVVTCMAELPGLVAFVQRSCASVGASEETTSDVRLATEEVFTNILQHGYTEQTGPVTVQIEATPMQITVILTDDAPVFDPSDVDAPDLASDGEHRALGGLGWHLVHRVMDQVTHERGAQNGNVFTLVKRLSAGPPGSGDR
ncbi:ATP-binding protein [Ruania alba]|uniref:Anti-sigma regulatory factor (Ser/Thr protein kinase) n=1 Tax=Ruania alba TaxID=648782 RepID=A0A1H5LHE6_9MICO|nr:ATP-binding protein [Ruania alba]SEE75618.1 Anti-sigma regulatory factor (Ser/Thr protein kinase) [Ruania alba]